jgi:hypothetical protein
MSAVTETTVLDLDLDLGRAARTGAPEVVLAAGKTVAECTEAAAGLLVAHGAVLVTRASEPQLAALQAAMPTGVIHTRSRCFTVGGRVPSAGPVAVVSAGTGDAGVAEEAAVTLAFLGVRVQRFADCGIAGLHRLLGHLPRIRRCCAIVAIAGMEGALPSVLGGLVATPLIAVPTSVGYGVADGGRTALQAMLTSCSAGITVVNIDNGFGAGHAAATIAHAIAGNRHRPRAARAR